jgi:DNA-binding NtrC family response regulator
VNAETLLKYLPQYSAQNVPTVRSDNHGFSSFDTDREIIFQVLRDNRAEINELKKIVLELLSATGGKVGALNGDAGHLFNRNYNAEKENMGVSNDRLTIHSPIIQGNNQNPQVIEVEETLSLQDKEIDMIKKALRKHKGKRKNAAKELGISERTLYRKINEYAIEE